MKDRFVSHHTIKKFFKNWITCYFEGTVLNRILCMLCLTLAMTSCKGVDNGCLGMAVTKPTQDIELALS